MCNVCSTFNPYLNHCFLGGLSPTGGSGSSGAAGGGATVPQGVVVEEGGTDAGDTTGTSGSFNVGEFYHGSISTVGEADWIAVDLTMGEEYTIAIAGIGGLTDSLRDPYLRLRDSSGNEIAQNDDITSGDYRFSDLTFTATYTGTYYIDVQSFSDGSFSGYTGDYGASITTGSTASYSDDMAAGMLLSPNAAWTTTPGSGATVTWAIRDTLVPDPANNSDDGNPANDVNSTLAVSATQAGAINAIMSYIDDISGLDFTQVDDGSGTSDDATILFGAYDHSDGRGAYAFFPDTWGDGNPNTATSSNAGDVWLNNDGGLDGPFTFGSFATFATLHELGHAIGLAHPGPYNAGEGGAITYANNAIYSQDSHQYTVMSYFDETETGVSAGLGNPDTFMLHDLLAIHQLYGANTNYNAGDTTYGFNATEAGSVYDFTVNTTPFMSVYDGSGTADLIDLSGYSMAQVLDLNEGVFSNIGGYVGNFSIAYGAVIENAIGGTGDDSITGNDAANDINGGDGADTILGGIGADTLTGGAGADSIVGGAGADSILGGNGNDTIDASDGADVVVIDPVSGSVIEATGNGAATLQILDPLATNLDPNTIQTANGATINHSGFGTIQFLCFCPGTRISTQEGCVNVEDLAIGDLVTTNDGHSVPVTWIGRQTVLKSFAGERARFVRIKADAISPGVPCDDLCLTADHAVFIDGLLVNASALVNDHSIILEPLADVPERFTVYHVETAQHDLILANEMPAETYLDIPGRMAFDNYDEYVAFYGTESNLTEMPFLRVSSARLVPQTLRDRLHTLPSRLFA